MESTDDDDDDDDDEHEKSREDTRFRADVPYMISNIKIRWRIFGIWFPISLI